MSARYALAAALALLFALPTSAQLPGLASRGGGTGSDIGERVAVTVTGGWIVTGEFEQTATFGAVSVTSADAPAARSDVFVVKYASNGTPLWARRMGTGVFNDFAGGVAEACGPSFCDQSVYVSGYFTGEATWDGGANPSLSLTTRNDFDAFLAKYTASGDLLWVEQLGGPDQDVGREVAADGSGGAYVTGSFYDTATFGRGADAVTLTSRGGSDGFLAHYEGDGTLDWVLQIGGADSDDARMVKVDPLGQSVFVGGTFRGVMLAGALAIQSRGLSDAYAMHVSEAGVPAWVQQVGSAGNDYGRGLAVLSQPGGPGAMVFLAGSFEETMLVGTDVLTSAGFSDVFLAALQIGNGELQWGRRGGGAGFDIANDVAVTNPLGIVTFGGGPPEEPVVVVTGYIDGASTFSSSSGTVNVSTQGVDGFLAAYTSGVTGTQGPAGTLLNAFALGGANSDRGYGIAIGPNLEFTGPGLSFRIVATGGFRDTATFGTAPLTSAGSNDVYMARFESCPTLYCQVVSDAEEAPGRGTGLEAPAPNPASGSTRLALTLEREGAVQVAVFDALGRRVALLHDGTLAAGRHTWTLDAGRLAPGAYLVRAEGEGLREVRRLAVVQAR